MNRMNRSSRWMILAALLITALWAHAASAALAPPDAAAKLAEQTDHALRHAGFALASENDQGFQNHAHHVVNIIVGKSGMGFDASFGNPGDGYGALEYARDLRASADVSDAGWQNAAQNIARWLEKAAEGALRVTETADQGEVSMARTDLVTAIAFLSAAKGREDEEAPVAGILSLHSGLLAAEPEEEESSGGGGYY